MHLRLSWLVPIAALVAVACALFAGQSRAEPQAPSKEATDDASFAKGFIGKTYDDQLDIDGWDDVGGGLVVAPVFVHEYQREDGTFLVLTSRQLAKETGSTPASYEVVDALVVPPPQSGVSFTISCVQGQDGTLRFMGEAKGPEDKEWWSDVRRAWEISLDTGLIASIKTKGVRCTNTSWGQ